MGGFNLVTILTVLVTVYLSLVKPMRMAAKISPVEAMRYQGEIRERKGAEGICRDESCRTDPLQSVPE